MPAGVTWGEYLRVMAAALGSMFLGSQAVHLYYQPLDDMTKVINELRRVKQKQLKEKEGSDVDATANSAADEEIVPTANSAAEEEIVPTVSEGDTSVHVEETVGGASNTAP